MKLEDADSMSTCSHICEDSGSKIGIYGEGSVGSIHRFRWVSTSEGVGERTTCKGSGGTRKSEIKFISSSASNVDDSAEGQGPVPRLVEPRFLVQVRKTEVTIASTTPQRLVEGLGTGAKVDENGPGARLVA